MPIDTTSVYNVPTIPTAFAEQNIFGGIYKYENTDSLGLNFSANVIYTKIDKKNYIAVQPEISLVINHFLQIGAFCAFVPVKNVIVDYESSETTKIYFNNYSYCGNSFSYTPWAESIFHPKIGLYGGLGRATGNIYNSNSLNAEKTSYTFYVVKPVVTLETNILTFLKWNLGLGYRLQLSSRGPSKDLEKKASALEFSTGFTFSVR